MEKTSNVPLAIAEINTLLSRLNGLTYVQHLDEAAIYAIEKKLWSARSDFADKGYPLGRKPGFGRVAPPEGL